MIRRPPRSTPKPSSAASDVYKETALVLLQIILGAWTIWSNKAADIATAHVALGAILFSIGVALCALSFRLRQSRSNARIFERPQDLAEANVT
jgi:heme A synthase